MQGASQTDLATAAVYIVNGSAFCYNNGYGNVGCYNVGNNNIGDNNFGDFNVGSYNNGTGNNGTGNLVSMYCLCCVASVHLATILYTLM